MARKKYLVLGVENRKQGLQLISFGRSLLHCSNYIGIKKPFIFYLLIFLLNCNSQINVFFFHFTIKEALWRRVDGLIDQFTDVGIFYQCRRVLKCKDSIHHCDFLAWSMTNSEWCIRSSRTTATASPKSSKIRLILWSEFQAHRMSLYMAFILVAFYKSNVSPCFMW